MLLQTFSLQKVIRPVEKVFFGSAQNAVFSNSLKFVDVTQVLQKYLAFPLFQPTEKPFQPNENEMKQAENLFNPKYQSGIKFIKSAIDPKDHPITNNPEVVFLGQSNVGKSSLIKALFHMVPDIIVRTSKKAGFTKTVNFFQVGKAFTLVDMPGYGINQPKHFTEAVQGYLTTRHNLRQAFLLIDAEMGIHNLDLTAIEMYEEFKIPFTCVMTKIDKAARSKLLKNLMDLVNIRRRYSSPYCYPQPFLLSSTTGEGLAYLQAFIAFVTNNLTIEERLS